MPVPSPVRRRVGRLVRRTARKVRRSNPPAPVQQALTSWRYPDGPVRLVHSPVFLLSTVRSGSTLLRVILNSHSKICAPHEMHLMRLKVDFTESFVRKSLKELDLSKLDLENMLWDRVLHRQLVLSGKSIVVDKTPQNVAVWPRIAAMWPAARYLFLLRHPASVKRSLAAARPSKTERAIEERVLALGTQLNDARAHLRGHTVRYEDLVADPEGITRGICDWLHIGWERGMLEYGQSQHGTFASGVGDWSSNIQSGKIQPPKPLPSLAETPERLRALTQQWGY